MWEKCMIQPHLAQYQIHTGSASLAKRHNNANIIAFGARIVGIEMAKAIVDAWLSAEFEGGRHAHRVGLLMDIENRH